MTLVSILFWTTVDVTFVWSVDVFWMVVFILPPLTFIETSLVNFGDVLTVFVMVFLIGILACVIG